MATEYNKGDIVVSNVKKKHGKTEKLYCDVGDKLKVIASHVDVLIVELRSNRFSIHVNDLKNENSEK